MWFTGSIVEAIKLTKQKNAIFVVYVEGNDDASKKITSFLNDIKVRSKLECDMFVAIRIQGGSESYMQFAKIYQIVPLPSLFFIGKNGIPLEVACAIDSVENLEKMIDRAINCFTASADVNALPEVEEVITRNPPASVNSNQPCDSLKQSADEEKIVHELKTQSYELENPSKITESEKISTTKNRNQETESISSNINSIVTATDLAARIEETRKVLELKRRERVEEEKRLEKEQEISRLKSGRKMNAQAWQKEQELKEFKNNIRRERREEQEARQRILEKIAHDRVERTQKFAKDTYGHTTNVQETQNEDSKDITKNSNITRLNFRVSDGGSKTHTFNNNDNFDVVRTFVKNVLLSDSGNRSFTLATNYPKKEFTAVDDSKTLQEHGLCPSAVILVNKRNSRPSIAPNSARVHNIFYFSFWTILSPILTLLNYLNKTILGGEKNNTTEFNKSEREKQINPSTKSSLSYTNNKPSTSKSLESNKYNDADSEIYSRRIARFSNIHRLTDNHDTDDENATWNGNSTQQQ